MSTPTDDREVLAEYYVANSLCTDPEPCAECLSAGRAVINDVKATARAEGRAEVAASVEALRQAAEVVILDAGDEATGPDPDPNLAELAHCVVAISDVGVDAHNRAVRAQALREAADEAQIVQREGDLPGASSTPTYDAAHDSLTWLVAFTDDACEGKPGDHAAAWLRDRASRIERGES